jgi:hypothetical protein
MEPPTQCPYRYISADFETIYFCCLDDGHPEPHEGFWLTDSSKEHWFVPAEMERVIEDD